MKYARPFRHGLVAILAISAVVLSCSIRAKKSAQKKSDPATLEGVWYAKSVTQGSETVPLTTSTSIILKIEGDTIQIIDLAKDRELCPNPNDPKKQPYQRADRHLNVEATDGCKGTQADIESLSDSLLTLTNGKLGENLVFDKMTFMHTTDDYYRSVMAFISRSTSPTTSPPLPIPPPRETVVPSPVPSVAKIEDLQGFWKVMGLIHKGKPYGFGEITDDGTVHVSADPKFYIHFKGEQIAVFSADSTADSAFYAPYRISGDKIIVNDGQNDRGVTYSGYAITLTFFYKTGFAATMSSSSEEKWYVKKDQAFADSELRNNPGFQKLFTVTPITTNASLQGYWLLSKYLEGGVEYGPGVATPKGWTLRPFSERVNILEMAAGKVNAHQLSVTQYLTAAAIPTFDVVGDYLRMSSGIGPNLLTSLKIMSFSSIKLVLESMFTSGSEKPAEIYLPITYDNAKVYLQNNSTFKSLHGITD